MHILTHFPLPLDQSYDWYWEQRHLTERAVCKDRHPEKIPPRRVPEGSEDAPPPPVRQPRVLGCLAVMLLASSITEVKLGVPAVSIRLGLQVRFLLSKLCNSVGFVKGCYSVIYYLIR